MALSSIVFRDGPDAWGRSIVFYLYCALLYKRYEYKLPPEHTAENSYVCVRRTLVDPYGESSCSSTPPDADIVVYGCVAFEGSSITLLPPEHTAENSYVCVRRTLIDPYGESSRSSTPPDPDVLTASVQV